MQWSDIPFSPSPKTLRQFALLWVVFFGGLAAWEGLAKERGIVSGLLLALAATVGGIGLVQPRLIRPVFVGWMVLAFPIGWTVSLVLLALIYYGLFFPIGLALRLARHDPLGLRVTSDRSSYWSTRSATASRQYFRQF